MDSDFSDIDILKVHMAPGTRKKMNRWLMFNLEISRGLGDKLDEGWPERSELGLVFSRCFDSRHLTDLDLRSFSTRNDS
jgi:hypothetical protein